MSSQPRARIGHVRADVEEVFEEPEAAEGDSCSFALPPKIRPAEVACDVKFPVVTKASCASQDIERPRPVQGKQAPPLQNPQGRNFPPTNQQKEI